MHSSLRSTCFLVVLMLLMLSGAFILQSLLLATGYIPCMVFAAVFSLGATYFIWERDELFCLGGALWAGLFLGFIVGTCMVGDAYLALLFVAVQMGCIALHVRALSAVSVN